MPRMRVAMCFAIAMGIAAPSPALTFGPSSTPTPTPTCAPTGTPYCATQCQPCPTIRLGCYAQACGACRENPVCGPGETCEPVIGGQGFGGCCFCTTPTGTPEPPTPTPDPSAIAGSPSPTGECDGDCNGDGAITIDELIGAVREALGSEPSDGCASFDRDGDGAVAVHELIALVATALHGCLELDLTGLDGVYDIVAVDSTGIFGGPGLAVVQRDGRRLRLDINSGIGEFVVLDAEQAAGGTLAFDGWGATSGDLAFEARGSAALTRGPGATRLEAVIDIYNSIFDDGRVTLTLERPNTGTPSAFGGTHVLRLQHSAHQGPTNFASHIELAITVPPSGRAMCAAASDRLADDTVLAELPATDCDVSPLGRFAYSTRYENGDGFPPPLQLFGALSAGPDDQGSGFFSIGLHPVQRDTGIWQAER